MGSSVTATDSKKEGRGNAPAFVLLGEASLADGQMIKSVTPSTTSDTIAELVAP